MNDEITDYFIRVKELRPTLAKLVEVKYLLALNHTEEHRIWALNRVSEIIIDLQKKLYHG